MLLYMALYATFEYNEDIKVARNMYSNTRGSLNSPS